MHLQKQEPEGEAALSSTWSKVANTPPSTTAEFTQKSSSLPFGQPVAFSSINGPTYLTAQTLIQQVAYALSDKIFSYSPETFDLDFSVKQWAAAKTTNAYGYPTTLSAMQTRSGAGAIALGYMFSDDYDLKKRHIPQSLLASSSSLQHLRPALDQLSLLYSVASPLVAHIAAVDYSSSSNGLVTDYVSALSAAEDLGLGLVSSSSAYEAQHMSLFATLLARILPTLHIYDGVRVGRETVRVIDVLHQNGLNQVFSNVSKEVASLSKKAAVETKVEQLLKAFNSELGTAYDLFEYHGHANPETVLVVFGSVEASLASQVAIKLSEAGAKIGAINVRVYRPFLEEAFIAALPTSVRTVAVLGQVKDQSAVTDESVHSNLYEDVLAALLFSEKFPASPAVVDTKYGKDEAFTPDSIAAIFQKFAPQSAVPDRKIQLFNTEKVQQYTFWNLDEPAATSASVAIGQLLSNESSTNVFLKQTFDNFVQGGTTRTDIRSSKTSVEAAYPVEEADTVVVAEEKLLKEIDVLKNIKLGGKLLVKLSGFKDEDLEKKLSTTVRTDIHAKKVQLFILDPTLSVAVGNDASLESLLIETAFLKIARPDLLSGGLEKLAAINGSMATLREISADLDKSIRQIEIPANWTTTEAGVQATDLPRDINSSSFTRFEKNEVELPLQLRDWQAAAKGLVFKEAYGTETGLRPDLSVKTYTIHVKENRRLTPLTYDRNVFHIEFDIGTSGLKYDIGEALGIHAQNDAEDVHNFIAFYGLKAEDIVEVPSRDDASILETRTVYQTLLQNLDIFGKPPKRFYESLAEFATSESEKKSLLKLSSAEGAAEFKRRTEVDTVTYADILAEFSSARPLLHDLARIVAPLKRREYSIASSQAVNPTTIALMIVVVSWVDPRGRSRFGQATRYLSELQPGTPVTVSVKPSVMKLPTSSTAPLIMAGLGTGLAPFRAFVQYRAMQKAAGIPIGAILLYMGSRHQREEYLYGEEWEAYRDAGVITLLGRAFSRDQPQKIYIQDRMRQTMGDIVKAYIEEQGAFYLCGPTWPVPDVTEVLMEAVEQEAASRGRKIDSRKEMEKLKDEGRYVLEVY